MKKILFLFVAALCFGSWATAGDLTFEKVGDFAWVNKGAIVAIDINGDGYQSVLYMERADDKRSVYLANNKGTLTKYEYGKEEGLKDLGIAFHENPGMVVMDVNKDGKQDVVVAGGWPPAVNVYLNNGAGAFTKDEKQTNLIGARDYDNSDYLAAGDYDNDGWEDLFVLGLTNEDKALQLSIYRNNNGVFELAQSLEGCRGGSIAVGDVNGDGNLDVFYKRLCVGLFHRSRRYLLVRYSPEVAVGRSHKYDRNSRVERPNQLHQVINRATEGFGCAILHLTKAGIAVNIIVDSAIDYDQIGIRIHVISSAAEAEIVACLFAGLLLVGKSCSTDSVIIGIPQIIHLF